MAVYLYMNQFHPILIFYINLHFQPDLLMYLVCQRNCNSWVVP